MALFTSEPRSATHSFIIEAAALRIGDDILKVQVGAITASMELARRRTLIEQIDGEMVYHSRTNAKQHVFVVQIGDHQNIKVSTWKDLVNVQVHIQNGTGSQGFMGEFGTARQLARDGKTVLTGHNQFGPEWQMTADEPNLFWTDRAPQAPQQRCRLPSVDSSKRSKSNSVRRQAAIKACQEHARQNKSAFVADILATGDLELIESGNF